MKDGFRRLLWCLFFPMSDWPFCEGCGVFYHSAQVLHATKEFPSRVWKGMCHICSDSHSIAWEKREQDLKSRPPLPSTNR